MAVIDCILFNDELELLEIRLHELDRVVDQFVIVESNKTFSGKDKEPVFLNSRHKFRNFSNKITHVIVRDMPDTPDAWERERWQRNAILRGLKNIKDTDVILISDADEIPNAWAVSHSNTVRRLWSFEQRMSYYHVNRYPDDPAPWHGTMALPYSLLKVTTPQVVRDQRDQCKLTVALAGWHFSYLGGSARISNKIKSFSHTELVNKNTTDEGLIGFNIETEMDLFTPGKKWHPRKLLKEDVPQYLWDNQAKFSHLIAKVDHAENQ